MAALMAMCGPPAAQAHDFWLQPQEYRLNPATGTAFTLQVGHGPFRQRSPIPLKRISRFEAIAPDGAAIELRERLRLGEDTGDGAVQFSKPGIYVLILETDNRAQSHLPAIRFNDYLEAEGLTLALQQRAMLHRVDVDGSEIYSRHAKAIVQVGHPDPTIQAAVTEPVGLPLEIVPERNPYALPLLDKLPIHVLYKSHSLPGALVKLTDLDHDAVPLEMHRTDETGHATFAMPTKGSWLLNVIWTQPLPNSAETDFETYFSSLSFGFAPAPP